MFYDLERQTYFFYYTLIKIINKTHILLSFNHIANFTQCHTKYNNKFWNIYLHVSLENVVKINLAHNSVLPVTNTEILM